jgi:hypothetical protein
MKMSKWIAAMGVAAGVLFGAGHVATAAPAPATPSCPDGAASAIVIDENGVQHEACVAVAAEATPPTPQLATLSSPALPQPSAGPVPTHATLPSTGVGSGGIVIAAVLVGSGSIVSLLSRRRPNVRRKGFRGRRVTP